MTRRRIAVVCTRHDRPVTLGVLIPPARERLPQEHYDAYVEQWVRYIQTTTHPEWSPEQCRTKALELARKNEVSQTEITYESSKGRLTKAGQWKDVEIHGIAADMTREGRMFTLQCARCKQPRRVNADRLADVLATLAGTEVSLADL